MCSVTVSMLVQYMNTELCNETSIHTKTVNSSQNWRRTPVRQDQNTSRKCSVARTYITRIIEDSLPHAFATRTLKTSTRCAHMALFRQMELNKMRTSHRSLPATPTRSHPPTRSDSTYSLKHSMISGPFLPGLTALHVLYSASFPVFSGT